MRKPTPTRRNPRRAAAITADQAETALLSIPNIGEPAVERPVEPKGKIGLIVALLRGPEGTTIAAMMAATGWQAHSVRGALSGSVKKTLGLAVVSEQHEAGRVYRIDAGTAA